MTNGAAARDGETAAVEEGDDGTTQVSPDALVMCGFGEVGRAVAKVLDDAGLGSAYANSEVGGAVWGSATLGSPGINAEFGGWHTATAAAAPSGREPASGSAAQGATTAAALPSIVAFTTREVRIRLPGPISPGLNYTPALNFFCPIVRLDFAQRVMCKTLGVSKLWASSTSSSTSLAFLTHRWRPQMLTVSLPTANPNFE